MATTVSLSSAVQSSRNTVNTVTWTGQNLTGATITATKRAIDSDTVTSVTGTFNITSAAAGIFTWTYSAADVGAAGVFLVQFRATYTTFDATIESTWIVHPLQSATAVAAQALLGVTAAQAAALDAAASPSGANPIATIADVNVSSADPLVLHEDTAAASLTSGQIQVYARANDGFTVGKIEDTTGAIFQLVRDNVYIARNTSGSQINKGQAVRVVGATGNKPNIGLANATSLATLADGLALENIADNGFGRVIALGNLGSLNTSSFSEGDDVYLSTTPGALVTPSNAGATQYQQKIGVVLLSNASTGIIHVDIGGGVEVAATTSTNDALPRLGGTGLLNSNMLPTIAVAGGGTGATTAADARTNLGLGTLATQSGTFSGGGTFASGGFTLTVPATGTAALLAVSNVFTAAQQFPDGSSSAPSITFSGETGLGLRRVGAASMGFVVGGVDWGAYASNTFSLGSAFRLGWASTSGATGTVDCFLSREAAAIIQIGLDAASPVAQTFKGPDATGTNNAGANLTIAPGRGTGTGIGGFLLLQTAPAGGSGSTANTLKTRWSIQTGGILYGWQESSTTTREVFDLTLTLPTATDATRKGRAVFNVYDTATREALRIEADGSAAMIGFLGAAAALRQTISGSRGGNAALASLLTALATLGLITDSTSA